MKEIEIVAKSGGKEVGKGKCPQYETLKEAVQAMGDEAKVLSKLNQQVKTDATNNLRKASEAKSPQTQVAKFLTKAPTNDAEKAAQEKVRKLLAEQGIVI